MRSARRTSRPARRGIAQSSIAFYQLRSQIAMLEAAEALERDQQGLVTVNSMLALVNGLRTAPGRKAVVLFSEGLVLPPRAAMALRSLIAEANRGGVTFYAADATGLRTVSTQDEARRELSGIVEEIRTGERTASGGGVAPPSRPLTKALERNEDILRSDPKSGLGSLARETGGFLVSDTNDIARALPARRGGPRLVLPARVRAGQRAVGRALTGASR